MDALKLFGFGTLASGINATDTSATLTTGDGQFFPDTATGAYNLIIYNSTDYSSPALQNRAYVLGTETESAECFRVTTRSTDSLSTIVRGQEGTTATTHNKSGKTYTVMLSVTPKTITDLTAMTTVFPLEDPQINVSSVGSSYTDTTGDTYAETASQTRITMSSTHTRVINLFIRGHVSAGTGTYQLYNVTDGTSLATITTTSTSETAITQIQSFASTNNGDVITLRVKNSNAGATTYIDDGGIIVSDGQASSIASTGYSYPSLPTAHSGGIITNMKIAVLRRDTGDTATIQLALNTKALASVAGAEVLTNIGATFGTSEANSIITRTPTFWIPSNSGAATQGGLILNTTAVSGTYILGFAFEMKMPNL